MCECGVSAHGDCPHRLLSVLSVESGSRTMDVGWRYCAVSRTATNENEHGRTWRASSFMTHLGPRAAVVAYARQRRFRVPLTVTRAERGGTPASLSTENRPGSLGMSPQRVSLSATQVIPCRWSIQLDIKARRVERYHKPPPKNYAGVVVSRFQKIREFVCHFSARACVWVGRLGRDQGIK